ncbi:MAG: protein translocase subunit SecF [Acidimicrobiia bacterium]
MSAFSRLMQGRTKFDFVGLRKRWFALSGAFVAISLAAVAIFGLNLGLEFRGGVAVQAPNPAGADVATITDSLAEIGLRDVVVQLINDGEAARVETLPLDQAGQDELRDAVAAVTGTDRSELSLDAVEPRFGALLARQALIALGVFLAAASLYMSWRLEWRMAAAAMAALVHDLIITVGIYAITGFPVTSATLVALLTILGYSLYDTVVVFDQVAETAGQADETDSYPDVINEATNHVLIRSLATSVTSLLPVGSLLFVGSILLGAASLQDFALALFVGISVGTFSSVLVAGPLLAEWKKNAPVGTKRTESAERSRQPSPVYTPRLTTSGSRRPPTGGSAKNRPPRPPKGAK